MLRILNYTPLFLPHLGGTELNVYYFAKYSRHRHHVLTDALPKTMRIEKIDNIMVYRVPPARRISPTFMSHFQNLLLDFPRELLKLFVLHNLKYDLLHLRAPFITPDLFWLLDQKLGSTIFKKIAPWKFVKKPIVVTFHALPHADISTPNKDLLWYPNTYEEKLSWLEFEKQLCEIACAVICVDRYMVRALSGVIPNNKKLRHIPSGIDTNIFKPMSKEEARSALPRYIATRLPKDTFLILYVGRLDVFRGAHTLSELAKLLPRNYKLVVVGRRNVFSNIRLDNTIYLDSLPNDLIPYLINACDVVFNPVLSNGISRITLEGMACAKPVIMFNSGLDRFPGVDGKNILLVRNVKEASDILIELKNNASFYAEISENAWRTAQQYSVQKLAQEVDTLYEKCVATHRD